MRNLTVANVFAMTVDELATYKKSQLSAFIRINRIPAASMSKLDELDQVGLANAVQAAVTRHLGIGELSKRVEQCDCYTKESLTAVHTANRKLAEAQKLVEASDAEYRAAVDANARLEYAMDYGKKACQVIASLSDLTRQLALEKEQIEAELKFRIKALERQLSRYTGGIKGKKKTAKAATGKRS